MSAQQCLGTEVTEASSNQADGKIETSVTPATDNPPPLTMDQARLVVAVLFGGAR